MNERDRIARLRAKFGLPPRGSLGIGDDAAVVSAGRADGVLSVDASVEGVHFSRDLLSVEAAAARAVEAAMSDVAAMGASMHNAHAGATGILCAWILPKDFDDWDFDALLAGTHRAVSRAGTYVLGGNLAAGPCVALTTTVFGRMIGEPKTRSGAQVGDEVWVSGPLGRAALGLRALGAQAEESYGEFVEAWRSPRARLDLADVVAAHATAAIDVSDGLGADAAHIAAASEVCIALEAESFPWATGQIDAAEMLGTDALTLALEGGEDYELLVTANAAAHGAMSARGFHRIGRVERGEGVTLLRAGVRRVVDARGWDHFEDDR